MDNEKNDLMKRELMIFALVVLLSVLASLYLLYKAAFCFDPYYTFRTENRWPDRILPCVKINFIN